MATPDRWLKKFKAVRSAVRRDARRPDAVATVVPGPTRSPSDATADVDARYLITVTAADATTFTLRATPVNGQVDDGMLELDASGARRWDKNDDADFGEFAHHLFVAHEPDPVGADDDASDEEADDGRQSQPMKRDRDANTQGEKQRQFEQHLIEHR